MDNEKKEYTLWHDRYEKWSEEGLSYVIDTNEISVKVYLGEYTMIISGVNVDEVETCELNKKLSHYEKNHPNYCHSDSDDMEAFFNSIGYQNAEAYFSDVYEEVEKSLIYDFNDETFANQADLELKLVYEYGYGKILELSEDMKKTVVEVNDESVSLDEFVGWNWITDYPHDFREVFKIQKINGISVKDKYLLMYSTKYLDYVPTGKILIWEEVKQYVEQLGCDVDEYMKKIEKLTIQSIEPSR